MPPSGFNRKSVRGALEFIQGCYEELLEEVRSGKHESVEAALKYEIGQIEKALSQLHINPAGELVEKKQGGKRVGVKG